MLPINSSFAVRKLFVLWSTSFKSWHQIIRVVYGLKIILDANSSFNYLRCAPQALIADKQQVVDTAPSWSTDKFDTNYANFPIWTAILWSKLFYIDTRQFDLYNYDSYQLNAND